MKPPNNKKADLFSEAYSDYFPLVYSMIYGKMGDPEITQDLCQEVFLRLFEKFDTVENIRKWLYGTLRNVMREYFRKKKDLTIDVETIMNDVSMSFVNGFRDSRLIIEEAIDNMQNFCNEKDRIVFELIAFYNFSYKDAAAHIGMSDRQVSYRYKRSVDQLLAHLKEKGIHGLEELL